jgi:hypothetical protein
MHYFIKQNNPSLIDYKKGESEINPDPPFFDFIIGISKEE